MSMIVILIGIVIIFWIVWYLMNHEANMIGANARKQITPQEYQARYAKRDHFLVDVRTAEEFRTGHIPGAVNISLQNMPQQLDTLPKDQPIILYCRSGTRSSSAAEMLTKAGFEDIHDLGGIMRWQSQGLPVH